MKPKSSTALQASWSTLRNIRMYAILPIQAL